MSSSVANFSSGVGVMDATLTGITSPVLDTNSAVGTADLSLNATQQQYVISNTNFTTATATVGNGISFSGWFYPSGTQTVNSTIFDISGSGCAVSLYYGTSNQLYGYFNGAVVQSTVTVVPGSWHFFCYTIYCTSITTALQSLYIDASLNTNGAYAATNTTGSYVSFSAGSGTAGTGSYLGYGRGAGPAYTYFNGKIDDFRFYNRVLSLPEINVLYSFNYKSGTTPTIVSQMYYDISYVNAVQIDVSGTFSGLYVTRTAQVGGVTNTTSSTVSCANLVFVNATTWAYVDTSVAADTSYSYTVQPYVMNTSGTVVNFGSITTTPIFNGFFNQGSGLPTAGNLTAVTTANFPGWSTSGSTLALCNGQVAGVYTGALPSTVTYYLDISQNVASSTSISQYVGIYQGTSGMVSFYAWPKDTNYNTTESISVSLGGTTLLNQYSFPAALATANPYTAFNLPFTMSAAGTYLLTITVTNSAANLSGINLGGVQIRSATTAGVGYRTIDPSGLALYYPFDLATVSGTVIYDCSAGFTGLPATADASLCGGAVLDTVKSLAGTADVSLNGSTCYVQMGSWTMPGPTVGNGFTIVGWFNPAQLVQAANATLCFFGNGTNNLMVYLNQQNNWLDFSYNVASGSEYISNTYTLQSNAWNFFAMTASCTGSGATAGTFTYYLNDVSMATQTGAWPVTGATAFTTNFLGGVPVNNPVVNTAGALGYFAGYLDDFRVYNRALTAPDVLSLWSYGFAATQYANVIDPSGLGAYYPFDQGSVVLRSPPTPITGVTVSGQGTAGFTLAYAGGTGLSVTTTYTVNGTVVTPTGSPTTGLVFTGLTAPTVGQNYVWTVVITATNIVGVTTGQVTVYPTPTVTGSWNSGPNTLTFTVGNYTTAGSPVYTYTVTGTGTNITSTSFGSASATTAALTGTGPWTVSVTLTAGGQTVTGTGSVASITFTVGSITGWTAGTDVSGTSVTNGITYNVYAFKPVLAPGAANYTYTMGYTCGQATYVYVLAVGGGGGGGAWGGCGGGAGGVVMSPVFISPGSDTITVSVGAGGIAGTSSTNGNQTPAASGGTTKLTFNLNTSLNINAWGGGQGFGNGLGSSGGSGSGIGANNNSTIFMGNNNSNNYGNQGSTGFYNGNYNLNGSGGGAGTSYYSNGYNGGSTSVLPTTFLSGGNGIQCFLPGISTFAPNGTAYGTYYWGGGGAGSGTCGNLAFTLPVNGGIGGGGGGGLNQTSTTGSSSGGGIALNTGGSGQYASASTTLTSGAGGANTGGGGGGVHYGTGGAGGSGIVVLAFPQTAITTNAKAVLPPAVYNSGRFNDVLSADSFNGTKTTTLSTAAYNSAKGAFSCKLINYNYFGPVMTLRHSLDLCGNYTANFYADVCGNLGTTYLGTGTSVSAWLAANGANTTYAYVTKWYDQAMDICFNSATQYSLGSQPIYDVANGLINFGYTTGVVAPSAWTSNAGNAFFNLPNGAYPYNDTSYNYTFKHYNYSIPASGSYCGWFGSTGGGGTNNASCYLLTMSSALSASSYNNYYMAWFWDDFATAVNSVTLNDVVTTKYISSGGTTAGSRTTYINGTLAAGPNTPITAGQPYPIRLQPNTGNCLGTINSNGNYSNAQFYYFYAFQSSLVGPGAGTDQAIVEATPYAYAAPAAMTLTVASITATNFVLSTSTVTGANQFMVYINGNLVYTSATGLTSLSSVTVTPGFAGPWAVNVYAYNSGYALLASGYYDTGLIAYYPFSNNIYNYANNVSGINDASIIGSATAYTTTKSYKAGITGSLYNSDGTYYGGGNCPHVFTFSNFLIPSAGGITIAFWIYPTSTQQTSADTVMVCLNGGAITLYTSYNTSNASNQISTPTYNGTTNNVTPAPINTWTHVAFTYTLGGVATIYINGSATYTYTDSTSRFNPNTTMTCNTLFTDNHGTGSYYGSISGYMNNFYLYTRTLTPAQIYGLYTQ